MIYHCTYQSPLGKMLITAENEYLTGLYFEGQKYFPKKDAEGTMNPNYAVLKNARNQLDHYFKGRLREFDLPLSPSGTNFQRQVWRELSAISFGSITSYGVVAKNLGAVSASRAVGAATGRNPLSILIP